MDWHGVSLPGAVRGAGRGVNREIEVLRAAAIAAVIVMHLPILFWPRVPPPLAGILGLVHPATGVDLFFVVSGYLIGRVFVRPFEAAERAGADSTRRFALAVAFWIRRAWRLFPAAWFWLLFTLAANLISGRETIWLTHRSMFHKTVISLLSLRNFEEARGNTFFGYMWSLSVENQFYALLPVFLLGTPRRARRPILWALIGLALLWRPGGAMWWMFRYDGLIWGLLLAAFETRPEAAVLARALPRGVAGRAGFVVLMGLAMLVAPYALALEPPFAWSVVNVAAAALVFAASREGGAIVWPPPMMPVALWLGARSYAVYLCHVPVWLAVADVAARLPALGRFGAAPRAAIACLLTLAAAEATHRLIELPGQARGRREAAAFLAGREAGAAAPA